MQFLSDFDGAWPQQALSSTPSALTDILAGSQQARPTSPRSSGCLSPPAASPNSGSSNDIPIHSSLHEEQRCSLPQRQFRNSRMQSGNSSSMCNHAATMVLSGSTHQPLAKYLMWVDLLHLKQAAHLTCDFDRSVLATLSKTAHFALALSPSGATEEYIQRTSP